MDNNIKILDDVVSNGQTLLNEYKASTGVIFRTRSVKRTIIRDVSKKISDPPVPKYYNKDKGREEENPADPDYLIALQKANMDRGLLIIDAYILFGSDAKFVPGDMPNWTDKGWEEELKLVGIEVPDSGRARYLAWVKYFAVEDDNDYAGLGKNIQRMSGVVDEDDVAEATEQNFQGDKARDTAE